MQIRELLKNNKISLRTYNICMEQQWHSSEDIRNYYNEYKHFDGIKNCGKRSMEELKRISSSDFFDRLQQEDVLNRQLLSSFETLTPLQKEIIDSYILPDDYHQSTTKIEEYTGYVFHTRGILTGFL